MSERGVLTHLLDTHVRASDAATILGVSRQRVVALCQRGGLTGAQLVYGRWLIPRATIEERCRNRPKPGRRRKGGC